MDYHLKRALPALDPYIESIWIQESAADPTAPPTRVLPTGRAEILVNYGDPFVHVEGGEEVVVPRVMVLGQRTRAVFPRAKGRTRLAMVLLRPWASGSWMPGMGTLVDDHVDGELVFGARITDALMEGARQAVGPEDLASRLQRALLPVLRGASLDPMSRACVERFEEDPHARVTQVSEDLAVSRRQLQRSFGRHVGLAPKRLSAVLRFQRAMEHLMAGRPACETALACGYADQAHLTHEVRAHSGLTPGALGRKPQTPLHDRFNGTDGQTTYL